MLTSFHTRYALLVCSPNTQRRSDGISSLIALCRSNQSIERLDCVQACITWLVLNLSSHASVIAALHWLRQRVVNEGRPFGSQAPHGLLQYEVLNDGVRIEYWALWHRSMKSSKSRKSSKKWKKCYFYVFKGKTIKISVKIGENRQILMKIVKIGTFSHIYGIYAI